MAATYEKQSLLGAQPFTPLESVHTQAMTVAVVQQTPLRRLRERLYFISHGIGYVVLRFI